YTTLFRSVRPFELRVVAEHRDLPCAILEHVLVLENAAVPRGAFAVLPRQREPVPATARAAPIWIERDDRRQEQLRVQPAGLEAEPAAADVVQQVLADRGLARQRAGRQ